MKLLKNRFFVTVVSVALVLCILPTVLTATGHGDFLRSAVGLVSRPFVAAFNWAADGVTGFFEYFSGVSALKRENGLLREQLESLKADAARAEIAESENGYLRGLLGFVGTNTDITLIDAKVTGRQSNSYSVIYSLNRGSESGIEVNMAIVTQAGAAGYVTEVGIGWCRAVALTDPTAAVGIRFTRSGVYGVLEGSLSHRQDGLCVVSGIDAFADVAVGDILCSSGYGGIFPPDMPVGRVVSSEPDRYSRTVTYIIKPEVSFDDLTTVLIVTGFSVTADTGAAG